jgi:hypothetical protein
LGSHEQIFDGRVEAANGLLRNIVVFFGLPQLYKMSIQILRTKVEAIEQSISKK